ncbi:hypothetical protein IRJ34_18265 [Paenarthrobacter sp. GOM3]|uniref:hypothetical protein n=1 Tax=Paenarthrobacter sp. GOM3 TaxID=2782567 RepID=UPI001BABE591|nr:hypothetical protein [Paenarthrobacter sp. GOM3]WOH18277.1 hypothetical protein IRJ34_18265 [Paenarthrobacter sp. GOM3]
MNAHGPSPEQVLSALKVTGFLLEQEMFRVVENHGFYADISRAYDDPEEGKSREIDVFGWKPFFIHERRNCVFGIRLIIECKNPKSPYVVIGHTPNDNELGGMRGGYSFWASHIEVGRTPHPNGSAMQSVHHSSLMELLGLNNIAGNPTDEHFVGNQLIAMERKGSDWFAGNSHIFDGIVMPMVKAMSHYQQVNRGGRTGPLQGGEQSHNSLTMPILVTSNEIFEVNTDLDEIVAVSVPWTNVTRQIKTKNLQTTVKIQVVQAKHMSEFLEQRVLAFGNAVAERVLKCPEILMVRNLQDLPPGASREHLAVPSQFLPPGQPSV